MMNAPVDISSLAPVVHRSAWMSGQMKDASKWLVRLPQVVLDELMAEATRMDRASLVSISTHVVDAARLPRAAAALAEIEHEIMTGLGFALIKGLDPELDDGMLKACYWVMLNLMGKPISQNSYGDLLTDVMDTGKKLGGAVSRPQFHEHRRRRRTNHYAHPDLQSARACLVGALFAQQHGHRHPQWRAVHGCREGSAGSGRPAGGRSATVSGHDV
jgi:hypothetical protein